MPPPHSQETPSTDSTRSSTPSWPKRLYKAIVWMVGLGAAGALVLFLTAAVALAVAYPKLPDVSKLINYQPKLPLRVFTAEGALIGEFGEERRNMTPIAAIPQKMKDAILATEDARFFKHNGIDFKGMLRAGLANFRRLKSQGASTITMQVARNMYLSSERTYTRKLYEVLLTLKLEHVLTKDQILEIYMNQIFLGQRAHGFAAAADTYFGKPLDSISIAEAAMLAGIPKFPSTANPVANYARARTRQLYIIDRMEENGYITAQEAEKAKSEPIKIRSGLDAQRVHAEYVAEMARQAIMQQYGDEAYTRGLNVYTTINASEQTAAYDALRDGIITYEKRQAYRGPEKFIALPTNSAELDDAIDEALTTHRDNGDILAAVVLSVDSRKVVVARSNGGNIEISGDGLKPVRSGLSDKAPPNIKIKPGSIVRIVQNSKDKWEITQLPEVEGAFVAIDPSNGVIKALVGGFDFDKNKFNHVTQAWRQPGSSFKPFIYSASLEKGFTPGTMIDDAPLFFSAGVTGGQPWEPKNYDGKYDGPMTMRNGLARSKNMISIRILQSVGPKAAQEWVTRFGFDAEKHPAYLTMALGAGSVTPLQLATGYSVFANGGRRVTPWFISKITDQEGRTLVQVEPPKAGDLPQVIDPRNAFVMGSMLQTVARSGTAARAQATLKRPDLYGKTGTTNDSVDAWFAGYQPTRAAIAWIGYDTPRNLGSRETGGGLSLPIWISYMQQALKGVPVSEPPVPAGLVNMGGEWAYEEHAHNLAAPSIDFGPGVSDGNGGDGSSGAMTTKPPATEERNRILDLFKN